MRAQHRPVRLLPLVFAALSLAACSKLTEPPKEEAIQAQANPTGQAAENKPPPDPHEGHGHGEPAKPAEPPSNEKLEIKDLVVGKGAEAKKGDTVSVHYVGTLTDGKEFDASKKHGKPFDFELGAGRVIKGWDEGVAGMKVGGKRKLTVPPTLGYGARGFPPVIPPSSTLVFEVELLEVKKK
ncbi:MAG: FKBP-type peptidyl-prolyl cis-trans isomerase [Labilithrix sp.]|nr:FKBP-type peptidyl-prolyl cis-trans isomerase [Labilithrix sp.]